MAGLPAPQETQKQQTSPGSLEPTTCGVGQMAKTEAPFWNVPFLLAVRITVVKKVWVWLGESRTLQNTQMFLGRGRVVDGGRGMASGQWCGNGVGETGRRRGREWLGQGQAGRHI